MQADAKNNGLKLWGPDSFSIFPPFFKVHAKVTVDSSGSNVQNWAGLFACGVDSYEGLIAPLQTGFQNLSPDQINLASSTIVTVGTALATTWALNLALSSSLFWTGWGYALELALYSIAILAVIAGVNLYPDRGVAKTVLLGIGLALITLTVAGFANDPRMATFPVILRALIPPTDPAYAAEKYVINSFIINGLTTGSMFSAAVLFKNPLMWPFAIVTFVLGVVALYLASQIQAN